MIQPDERITRWNFPMLNLTIELTTTTKCTTH